MHVVSVNVGQPREVRTAERVVLTSIVKTPVEGRVAIRGHNLVGDRQADLRVHGGRDKAVYAYPSEHYDYWRAQMPGDELGWGSFGENLTIAGLLEDAVHLGDRLRVGSAELTVTQPRMPCFKLGIRHSRPELVKQFLDSRRPGFYLAVTVEGEVAAGDRIEIAERHPDAVSIPELLGLYLGEDRNRDRLTAAAQNPALAESWRRELTERAGSL